MEACTACSHKCIVEAKKESQGFLSFRASRRYNYLLSMAADLHFNKISVAKKFWMEENLQHKCHLGNSALAHRIFALNVVSRCDAKRSCVAPAERHTTPSTFAVRSQQGRQERAVETCWALFLIHVCPSKCLMGIFLAQSGWRTISTFSLQRRSHQRNPDHVNHKRVLWHSGLCVGPTRCKALVSNAQVLVKHICCCDGWPRNAQTPTNPLLLKY